MVGKKTLKGVEEIVDYPLAVHAVEDCKFRDSDGICYCLYRWKRVIGRAKPHPCPFSPKEWRGVCVDFEPKEERCAFT